MAAFVGSGISISDQGELCLPDGLCPNRVHRFIEVCTNERFASPREAMHVLFTLLGVSPRAVKLLNEIIDSKGDVEFGAVARHTGALVVAIPEFKQIPQRFRDFLVDDLGLASDRCTTLDQAVASAREAAAERVGCEATWDAILQNSTAISALALPWRERVAAA